jgi:drug/metabolite transporter (DMT)-like permease
MSRIAILLWITNIVLDTVGHLAFKFAAISEHESEWQRWRHMASNPPLWLGVACFALEFVVWLALLSVLPLSLAMLIGSINIVLVMLAGRLFFRERLDPMRLAGMALIALGVALAGAGA